MLKEAILKTLRAEVKPAIGCTEPVAIALAVAKAREASGLEADDISSIRVNLSRNIYKNAMGVGIPGTKLSGIYVAAALGAVACDSSDGLTVFSNVTEENTERAVRLVEAGVVEAAAVDVDSAVFVEAHIVGRDGEKWGAAVIVGKHDRFTHVENHDGVIFEGSEDFSCQSENSLEGRTLSEILDAVLEIPCEELSFLGEGADMNLAMAEYGLSHECGLMVGKKLQESYEFSDCFAKNAMILTAAAADARMDGAPLPVMSSSGSGNNGLTSIIPVAVYCRKNNVDEETMCRAIAISHLTNSIIKQKIGRLSALCGCALSAGSGAAAAICWLRGGTVKQIEGAIQNMIANTSGMICDGAKVGCALKLATSVSAAIVSSTLAMNDIAVGCGNGIIGEDADDSIENLGYFANFTKPSMDKSILEIMQKNNS